MNASTYTAPRVYKRVTVHHNHGILVLENAVVEMTPASQYGGGSYRQIRGTCVGGGCHSRLFHATSYQPFETGVEKTWIIGSSAVYLYDGEWRCDATFCG